VLFPAEFGPACPAWLVLPTTGTPMILVSGDGDEGLVHGMLTVQSSDEDRSFHDAAGRAWRNAYSIKLGRYGQSASSGGMLGVISNMLQ